MENYKLYIEDLGGTWHIADLGNEKPAMNYQVNNLAELKDRQADYSQALKMPFTQINCRIFGYANEFDVVTDIPYRKLNCRLLCNDTPIAGKGSYLILDRVTDKFEVRILSGNADLFESMKAIKMDNVYFDHIQHYDTAVLATDIQANDVFYGVCEFDKLGRHTTIQGANFFTKYSLPFVKLKALVEYLLSDYLDGYTLQTDVPLRMEEEALRIGNYQKDGASFNPYNEAFKVASENNVIIYYQQIHWILFNRTNMFTIQHDTASDVNPTFKYTAPHDIVFKGYSLLNLTTTGYSTGVQVYINGSVTASTITDNSGNITKYIDFSDGLLKNSISEINVMSLSAHETFELKVRIYNSQNDPIGITYSTITATIDTEYINPDKQDVPIGGLIPVARNLGFNTVFDVVKYFLQLYGLVPYIDRENKILYAYTFNYIRSLKSQAKDWSGKLNSGTKNFGYTLDGYAKQNYISLKENSQGKIEKGSFSINNDKLKNEATLFELPTKSAGMVGTTLPVVTIVNIDDIDIDENGNPIFDTKTPVCISYTEAGFGQNVNVAFEPGLQSSVKELPDLFPLDMNRIINTYYSGLVNILTNAKITEDDFVLTDKDIEEYKAVRNGVPGCFIPVYIQKYGAYFYVNKIKNFVSGSLTKCELIKL